MAQQNDGLNVPLSPIRTTLIVSLLTLGVLLVLTTIGLVVAFLVDISRDFHVSVPMAGQLLTVSAIVWALSSILLGPLSDRTGRKVMVLSGLVVGGIGFFGYALAPSFLWIMGLSVVVGIGGAMAGPHFVTCIGDYFSSGSRGWVLAIVNAGAPLSSLIGIPMGTYIANSLGWRASAQILGMIMILSGLLGFFVLPSSMPYRSRSGRAILSSFSEALRERYFLHLITANTLTEGAFHIVYSYLIAFLIIHFSLNLKQAAPLIAFMAIGQLIGNFVGGSLADRCDKLKICAVAQMVVGLAGLTMMTFAPALWFTVLFGALYKGAYSGTRPAFFSLMILSETSRGASMGLVAASNNLGRALGAMVGGLILGFTGGYHSLGLVCLALSICATAVFLYLIRSARKS